MHALPPLPDWASGAGAVFKRGDLWGVSAAYHHWKSNNLCLLSRGFLWHTVPQGRSTNAGAGALFCVLICFALLFLPSWCKLPNYANRHTFGSIHFWLNMTRKKPEFLWLPHTFSLKCEPTLIYSRCSRDRLLNRPRISNNSSKSFFRDGYRSFHLCWFICCEKFNTLVFSLYYGGRAVSVCQSVCVGGHSKTSVLYRCESQLCYNRRHPGMLGDGSHLCTFNVL